MMIKKLRVNSKGDTIVEVLIAMAILTLVLAGAYYTASSSYRNSRDSEEHSEALTLAQEQLEEMRTLGAGAGGFDANANHCVNNSSGTVTASNTCVVPSNDFTKMYASCPASAPYCYTVKITYPDPAQPSISPAIGVNFYTYNINVTWTPLGGGSTEDSVSLLYRMDTPAP